MIVFGGALLLWIAYKVGIYVEHKMKEKSKELEDQAANAPDSERKQ